ncbi:uncharacterized protein GIQ15_03867 [Arthroderma uncinatum]|uniref:uncharacterized protein n=1 Tax=Arthroderma uncinatum TaxID=74035 RepID=UPI00144AD074|nr:uncharacterized protein GIQ15_03867 [Arthroderma uncinatum]KAF3481108.1 hypothetical protein GIQ15_03867 [Arthroderma uncinatum]
MFYRRYIEEEGDILYGSGPDIPAMPIMDTTGTSSRSCPETNTLTTYLRLLRQCKPTLPYGELVCVSASPNISTMSSLLRLARTVGPYIGVLQVHADIIDDWSLEGVRRLARLAKKYAFLIWEGGRVLNTQQRLSNRYLTPDEVSRDIDMSRKRYTKGVVSVAAWAGLASTWMIDSPQQGNGADRLIPTLRRAARETVAFMTNSVRTEISSSGASMPSSENPDEEHEYSMELDEVLQASANEGLETSPSPRKASVISLTQTITQSTEPSTPSATGADDNPFSETEEEPADEDERSTPTASLPEPPLLSRGLIISAPRDDDERFTLEYRVAAFESAKANADFVVGFSTDEPWIEICTRSLCSEAAAELAAATAAARASSTDDENENRFKEETESAVEEERRTFAIFNPLETDHLTRCSKEDGPHHGHASPTTLTNGATPRSPQLDINATAMNNSRSRRESQQVTGLHQLIASAVAIRNSRITPESGLAPGVQARYGGFDVMFIPVVTMNI